MKTRIISYLLAIIQISTIAVIVGMEAFFCKTPYLLAIEILGILMVVYAVWSMKRGNFNISSIPKEQGELRTTHFYKVVRHPMYLSSLVCLFPLIIDFYSLTRLILFITLIIILILKLNFEEGLLIKQFPGYEEYKKTTWRLLPFIY